MLKSKFPEFQHMSMKIIDQTGIHVQVVTKYFPALIIKTNHILHIHMEVINY